MKYKQVVAHFGGLSKAAQALETKRQNVFNWGLRKRIPARWQMVIERHTDGVLIADPDARREALELLRDLSGR